MGLCQHLFKILEAVGTTIHMESVTFMQQAIQNGSGHYFVACEDLRPILYRLVCRNNRATAPVAIINNAKEECSILSGQGLKAHLIDNQKG
ncbi:hypothetical protein DBB_44680 [Desulfoluna spongiiphila]|nr:hypothetical protein DBB_44680 [Desulfoluna spongiiphila]